MDGVVKISGETYEKYLYLGNEKRDKRDDQKYNEGDGCNKCERCCDAVGDSLFDKEGDDR